VVDRLPSHDLTVDVEDVHRVDLSGGPRVVARRIAAGPAGAGPGSHSAKSTSSGTRA
jgi:hypothetical protein